MKRYLVAVWGHCPNCKATKQSAADTRMLLEEVWNHEFVPATNLVDVHMGRLRHRWTDQITLQ